MKLNKMKRYARRGWQKLNSNRPPKGVVKIMPAPIADRALSLSSCAASVNCPSQKKKNQ